MGCFTLYNINALCEFVQQAKIAVVRLRNFANYIGSIGYYSFSSLKVTVWDIYKVAQQQQYACSAVWKVMRDTACTFIVCSRP